MRTLMHLASVGKISIIKRIFQNMFYRGECERFTTSGANQAKRKHFALNCCKCVFAGSKSPQRFFYFAKSFSIWLNRAKSWLVEISERGFFRKFTTPNLLTNTTQNVFSQIVGVILFFS